MSTFAVIVILMLAALALTTLVAGRKAAQLRTRRHASPIDDPVVPYRSHAEASRRSEAERP